MKPAAAVPVGSKPVAAVAPLLASAAFVGLVMWTRNVAPAGRVIPLEGTRESIWLPCPPVIWKKLGLVPKPRPVLEESMVQSMSPPAPAGSGSLSITLRSGTVLVFEIVTVNPAVLPAVMEGLSAVLLIVILGGPELGIAPMFPLTMLALKLVRKEP